MDLVSMAEDLYEHRNLLFVNLCSHYPGQYYYKDHNEWPVVYLDLPQGQISYHFKKDSKAWRCFVGLWKRNEGGARNNWDGHDSSDVIERLYVTITEGV